MDTNNEKLSWSVLIFLSLWLFIEYIEAHSIPQQRNSYNIRSDVIVTHWPDSKNISMNHFRNNSFYQNNNNKTGWMRQQLLNFGQVASRIGNVMGTHTVKITSVVEKICQVVKTVIPLLAAVCHVGDFKFCASPSESSPGLLSEALVPDTLDLDIQD